MFPMTALPIYFKCIPPPPSLLCHADRTRELSPERLQITLIESRRAYTTSMACALPDIAKMTDRRRGQPESAAEPMADLHGKPRM